jgi:hypothetical protein
MRCQLFVADQDRVPWVIPASLQVEADRRYRALASVRSYLCRLCQRSLFSLLRYLWRAIFLRRFLTTELILYPWPFPCL